MPGTSLLEDLDGKVYFIRNFEFGHANIAQSSPIKLVKTCFCSVGTSENLHYDQLWQFQSASNFPGEPDGAYYITNVKHGARLMTDGKDIGVYDKSYENNQLWTLRKHENGEGYFIYNKDFSKCCIAKPQRKNKVSLCTTSLTAWDGDTQENDFTKWVLVPRFRANYVKTVIWSADNRRGSQDFSETVKLTKGLKLTSSMELTTKVGLEVSLKMSLGLLGLGDLESTVSAEISTTLSRGTEKMWQESHEIKFTAPAGKMYRVFQHQISFESDLTCDGMQYYGSYAIDESEDGSDCPDSV